MEPHEGTRVGVVCSFIHVVRHLKEAIFFILAILAGPFFDWSGHQHGDGEKFRLPGAVRDCLWALLLGGWLAEYLTMARLGAVFFFVGVVAFFADAAWWNNNTARLDCLVFGQPIAPVMQEEARLGRSIEQTVPAGSCSIMACSMAVEGMHYKVYETFHGPDTFPDAWKAKKTWTAQLLGICKEKGIWTENVGAVVGKVLSMIQGMGGVQTASGKGCQEAMRLDKYVTYSGNKITEELVKQILDQGPCVGRLFACPWWGCFDATENDNWVYRGTGRDEANRKDCKKRYPNEESGSHAVVCFQYRVCENGEMHVLVLDNHTNTGPERWVHVEELDKLYSLKVDCLCGSAEHHHNAGASGKVN